MAKHIIGEIRSQVDITEMKQTCREDIKRDKMTLGVLLLGGMVIGGYILDHLDTKKKTLKQLNRLEREAWDEYYKEQKK